MMKVIVDQYSHGWIELDANPVPAKAVIPGWEIGQRLKIIPELGYIALMRGDDRVTQEDIPGSGSAWDGVIWVYLVDPEDGVVRVYKPDREAGELDRFIEEKLADGRGKTSPDGLDAETMVVVDYPVTRRGEQ